MDVLEKNNKNYIVESKNEHLQIISMQHYWMDGLNLILQS